MRNRSLGWWVLAVVYVVIGAMVLAWAWWSLPVMANPLAPGVAPGSLEDSGRLSAIATTRTGILAGLVGLAALGTLFVNSRTLQFSAETARAATRTAEVTVRGHFTDRFSKAVEQTGSAVTITALGGLYSLQQLLRDASSQADAAAITNTLCAFIRSYSPGDKVAASIDRRRETRVAIRVLFETGVKFPIEAFNLANCELEGIQIWGPNVRKAQFQNSKLSDIVAVGADLRGAALGGARLDGALLSGCNLRDATFSMVYPDTEAMYGPGLGPRELPVIAASCVGTAFSGAHLEGARVHGVDLSGSFGLLQEQVDSMVGDRRTKLPDGLRRPSSWDVEHKAPPSDAR